MGTIVIRDPAYCEGYIRPHPNGMPGLFRLSYLGTGVPLVSGYGITPNVTTEGVAETLARLQERVPLGILGDYEILCTGRQLCATDDPAMGYASGIRAPGWIALSGRADTDLYDLLAHEIAHELWFRLTQTEQTQFWTMVGQAPGSNYWWEFSPWERSAEYLSAALWDTPVDARIIQANDPDPTPAVLNQLRQLILPIVARGDQARVTIGEEPHIVLTIGSTIALVDGREVTLDVAPGIVNGRTLVPVRFISEALGHRVDWEPHDGPVERVLIY